jgi:DNA repair protein RecO (recombination protein O)
MEVTESDALVCAVVSYGDDDAVVRLFSRSLGRVGAFARKARASRKRFPGLMAPALGRARTRPRRNGDLLELVDLDLEPALLGLANDPRALGYAAYVVELLEKLVPEAEPAEPLFDDAAQAMRAVCARGAVPTVLRALELKLLLHLGYLPDLHVTDAPGEPCEAYDPVAGRLVHRPTAGSVPFSDGAMLAARALLAADLDALPVVEDGLLRTTSRIFASHLRRHTKAPLQSVAFLHSLD